MAEFYEWLGATLAEAYGHAFAEHGFDSLEVLCGLTDDQLSEMLDTYIGIVKPGHRFLFLNRLAEVRGGAPVRPHTPLRTTTNASTAPQHHGYSPSTAPVAAPPRTAHHMPAGYHAGTAQTPSGVAQSCRRPRAAMLPARGNVGGLFDPLQPSSHLHQHPPHHHGQHIAPNDSPDHERDGPLRSPSPGDDDLAASAPVDHDEQQQQHAERLRQLAAQNAQQKRPKAAAAATTTTTTGMDAKRPKASAAPAAPWGGAKRVAAAAGGRRTATPPKNGRVPASNVAAVLRRKRTDSAAQPQLQSPVPAVRGVPMSDALTIPDATAVTAAAGSSASTPVTPQQQQPYLPWNSPGQRPQQQQPQQQAPSSSAPSSPTRGATAAAAPSAYDNLIAMLHSAPAVQSARAAQAEQGARGGAAGSPFRQQRQQQHQPHPGGASSPMRDLFQ